MKRNERQTPGRGTIKPEFQRDRSSGLPGRYHLWVVLASLFLWPILSGCNCEPTGLGGVSELIAVPKNVSYDAQQGQTQTKKVLLEAKVGTVQISSIELEKGAPHYKIVDGSLPAMPKVLQQGEQITFEVSYTAPSGEAITGLIRVKSDAVTPKDGELEIRLLAQINQQYLVFSPDPVNFGEVKRGETKTLEVVGENKGRATIAIEQIDWKPSGDQAFTFPDGQPKAPKELKPGETFKFKVEYSPTTAKVDTAELHFTCAGGCAPASPDPARRKDPLFLKFTGQLAAPAIEVSPLRLDFGFVDVGTESAKKVKISNKGTAPLLLSKITMKAQSSGAFVVPRLLDVTVAPGAEKELPVTFRPTTGSKHEGTIEIHSNDPTKPLVEVQLTGQVSAPDINVQPKVLDFGATNIPKQLAFTISNTGVKDLEVKTIVLFPGTSPEYKIDTSQFTLPFQLKPNQFQQVPVIYSPTDKSSDTGKIQITSNDPDEPTVEVELKAEGSTLPQCDLVGTPSRINFGETTLGTTKTMPIKWENKGDKDCEISAFTVATDRGGFPPYSGPDVYHLTTTPQGCQVASGKYTCSPPLVVKVGNSMQMNVGFTPVTEKKSTPFSSPNFTGYIEATTNGQPSGRRISFDGLGKEPCLIVSPDVIDFGLVTVNCSSQKESIVVYNICTQDVSITKIGFSAAGANNFRITKAPTVPHVIKGGQTMEVEVAYSSKAPAQKQNAVLLIENDVKHQNPMSVPMAAQGTTTAEQTDTFKQTKGGKVDILFVIDNSGSMGNDQKNLANNFKSFIQWASTLKVDFQIGITTTSVKSNPLTTTKAGEFVGQPAILTSNTPNVLTAFQQQALVGTGGSATEQGLDAMKLALSPPNTTTGRNQGFLRQDASLSIITVSDEMDSSSLPVQAYINFLQGLKGRRNRDLIRYNIVVGIDEQTLAPKCATAASNGRYLAVAQAFRGIIASICTTNWSNTLSRIGSATFGLKTQFFLSRAAEPNSIQVKVDGNVVTAGATTWSYSATDNSINFKNPPTQGATIQVTYKAICF